VFIFVDFQIELEEQTLVGFLELLDIGLGVFKQVDLFSLHFFELGLEGIGVKLQLILDLGRGEDTPMRLRTSVSPRCNSCSSLEYSSYRLRCLMN